MSMRVCLEQYIGYACEPQVLNRQVLLEGLGHFPSEAVASYHVVQHSIS